MKYLLDTNTLSFAMAGDLRIAIEPAFPQALADERHLRSVGQV